MASNPTWPSLTESEWNLVATNVLTGAIDKLKSKYSYWATYVLTGEAAPLDAVQGKTRKIFEDSNTEIIQATERIDVYIWLEDSDQSNDDTTEDAIMVAV